MTMNLEFDLSGLESVLKRVSSLTGLAEKVMPAALEAVRQVWQDQVSGGLIDDPRYAEAMQSDAAIQYPVNDDPYYGRIVVPASQQAHAATIEKGKPARDLKPGLLASKKSKRSKKGNRYLTVPIGFKAPKPGAFSPSMSLGLLVGTSPFRTVSDLSPAGSWTIPPVPGVHIVESVKEAAQDRIQRILEQSLRDWRA
jgi:hypothetical protein